jgi:hypothetical protein
MPVPRPLLFSWGSPSGACGAFHVDRLSHWRPLTKAIELRTHDITSGARVALLLASSGLTGSRKVAADGRRAKIAEARSTVTFRKYSLQPGLLLDDVIRCAGSIELVQQIAPGCCLRVPKKQCGLLFSHSSTWKDPVRTAIPLVTLMAAIPLFAQSPPVSPDRPWRSSEERQITNEGKHLRQPVPPIEPDKAYSLAELIDLAESHNPETRVAWENARVQGAALGLARSELYPTLSAVALSGVDREEVPLGSRFYRHTDTAVQMSLDLNYTIFDFGARRGRIAAESALVLAANFGFNDVHRKLIFQVQQAYYRLLNASAQDVAARVSLANAVAVQQAAEERLRNGLATLPDVLEARSATAQSEYDLQAVLGEEQSTRGDLATALGAPAATMIRVEPLSEVPTPASIGETVERVIYRALAV